MAMTNQGVIQGLHDRLPAAWPVLALAASAAMLATAHAFERLGGYAPCLLCLKQREVYWVAGGIAFAGLVLLRTRAGDAVRPRLALVLAAAFLFGEAFHVFLDRGEAVVAFIGGTVDPGEGLHLGAVASKNLFHGVADLSD